MRKQNHKASSDLEKNYLEIIKLLLDHGAGTTTAYALSKQLAAYSSMTAVDVKDPVEERSALLWACLLRNKETGTKIAQLLIDKGANVNQRDKGGNSALLLATAVGNKEIVKHLIRRDCVDVNQRNGKGITQLVTTDLTH